MTDGDEPGRFGAVGLKTADTARLAAQRPGRQAEAAPWDTSNLLNLTHDSIFVRDMRGVVKYWNRAAEELYRLDGGAGAGHDRLRPAEGDFPGAT